MTASPVDDVAFSADTTNVDWLPDPLPGNRYIVSLVVGLAAVDRDDLLVPTTTSATCPAPSSAPANRPAQQARQATSHS